MKSRSIHLAFDAMCTRDRTDQDHVVCIRNHEVDDSNEPAEEPKAAEAA